MALSLGFVGRKLDAAGKPANQCGPEEGFAFICGPVGTEDLVEIKGTRWLVGSGLNLGKPAHFVLIDSRRKTYSRLDIASAGTSRRLSGSECAVPPDPLLMSTSGLAMGRGNEAHLLYAVNQGDRRAIEIFRVQQAKNRPQLVWIGCALLPPHTMPNAVVALPGGKLIVSSFYNPDEADAWNRMERGEDVGQLLEWEPGKGFHALNVSSLSGPNGLEASADGGLLFVSAWADRKIIMLDLIRGSRKDIPLDFMPDNLRRLPDGRLLVAGQKTTPARIAACSASQCQQPWVAAVIDPRGKTQTLLEREGTKNVNYACTALLTDGTLFVTVRGADRIMYRHWRRDV